MELLKNIFFTAVDVMPFSWLNKTHLPEVLLPYHHVVSNEYLPHIKGLYSYKNEKQFTEDLDWLLKYRKPIMPDVLADCVIHKKPIPRHTFLLTFDDGFREAYEIAAPLLLRKGVPAIFFINPSFIDNRELFYRSKLSLVMEKLRTTTHKSLVANVGHLLSIRSMDTTTILKAIIKIQYPEREKADLLGKVAEIDFDDFLEKRQPFMRTEEIRKLAAQGFTIGAHSMDHPNYEEIPEEIQLQQTRTSLRSVQELIPSTYSYFSFPHSDRSVYSSFFTQLLSGTEQESLLLFGIQNQLKETERNMLHRFNAESPDVPIATLTKRLIVYKKFLSLLNLDRVRR